jgi:ABC-type multidrug transport system fused ATPase/permease subunit
MKETKLFYDMLFAFLKSQKKLTFVYILILFLMPILDIGVPHTIGKLVKALGEGTFNINFVYLFVGFIFCGQLITTLNDYVEIRLYPALQTFMSEAVVNYIMSRCKTCLQDVYTAKIIAMILNTPRTMYNLMEVWRSVLLPQFIVGLFSVVYFWWYNMYLGLILLLILVIYYVYLYTSIISCSDASMVREESLNKVTEVIDDVISNIVAVFNHNMEKKEYNYIKEHFKKYEKISVELFNCTLRKKYIYMPFIILLAIIFMYLGYKLVNTKKLGAGNYVAILIIFMYVFNSIIRVFSGTKDITIRWGIITENLKIFSSLEANKKVSLEPTTLNTPDYILFDAVSFKYKNAHIIENLNLRINKGENVLIVGHIGKGKTTLLKLLMRYKACSSGAIYIDGQSIETIPVNELRTRIGFIPQNPILLNRTLYENITYGSPGTTREHVLKLIESTGMQGAFDLTRLDENVGKLGSKLSGGQKQIVWILRVLLQGAEIILMDEPTSSLDENTKSLVKSIIKYTMKDHTVIIVSHDMSLVDLCNRVVGVDFLSVNK